MPQIIADVPTAHASRYLQQLCKHWGHRFQAEYNATAGRILFDSGNAVDLTATDDTLHLRLEAGTEDGLKGLAEVVAEHVRRFAFRETLGFDWR